MDEIRQPHTGLPETPEAPARAEAGGAAPKPVGVAAVTVARGADVATAAAEAASDFERLARAVEGLIERYQAARAENAALRRELAERDEKLRVLNQRRQDALKRIDDLIDQIDRLDARLEESA